LQVAAIIRTDDTLNAGTSLLMAVFEPPRAPPVEEVPPGEAVEPDDVEPEPVDPLEGEEPVEDPVAEPERDDEPADMRRS
jgi:hypothetical protein